MATTSARAIFLDRDDFVGELRRRVLDRPERRAALRRASAERIANWLGISRRCLFSTLVRVELTLADVQRERLGPSVTVTH